MSSSIQSSLTPPDPVTAKEWKCVVVGLRGLAGAGKTTIQRLLFSTCEGRNRHVLHSAPIIFVDSMAAPIRDCLTMIGVDKFLTPELYRKGAQWIGTELCRSFDPDWWVKRARKRLAQWHDYHVVVFDDIRFPNEAEICDLVFFIEPEFPALDLGENAKHASEQWNLNKEGRIDATIKNVHHKPSDAVDSILSHIEHYLRTRQGLSNPS